MEDSIRRGLHPHLGSGTDSDSYRSQNFKTDPGHSKNTDLRSRFRSSTWRKVLCENRHKSGHLPAAAPPDHIFTKNVKFSNKTSLMSPARARENSRQESVESIIWTDSDPASSKNTGFRSRFRFRFRFFPDLIRSPSNCMRVLFLAP